MRRPSVPAQGRSKYLDELKLRVTSSRHCYNHLVQSRCSCSGPLTFGCIRSSLIQLELCRRIDATEGRHNARTWSCSLCSKASHCCMLSVASISSHPDTLPPGSPLLVSNMTTQQHALCRPATRGQPQASSTSGFCHCSSSHLIFALISS